MIRLTRWVIRYPLWVTGIIFVITAFFAMQLKNMKMDPDITNSLPDNLEAKRLYDKMGEVFPSKEFVFVGLEADDPLSLKAVQTMFSLTQDVEKFPGVYQVISPTNIALITGTADGMDVRDVLPKMPESDEDLQAYRDRLFRSDLALKNLIARDTSALGMMIFLRNDVDNSEFAEKFIHFIDTRPLPEGISLFAAGKSILSHYIGVGMQTDMSTFFGGGILVIFVLLLFIFRNVRGVVLPLMVVIFSVIWTLGLMVLLGFALSHAITILPILVMAIAVADSIHILTHYMKNSAEQTDKKAVVLKTMGDMNSPVLMTSLTTIAGFISLGTVSTESIMELGLFTAAGVLFALILSLSIVPALLAVLKLPKARRMKTTVTGPFTSRAALATVRFSVKNFQWLSLLLLILALVGFSRLRHESSTKDNFPPDHPVRIAWDKVNSLFAGSTSFQIMFEGNAKDVMKDPRILRDMDDLSRQIRNIDKVGDTQSIADFIKKFNKVLNGDDPAFYRIPADTETIVGSTWMERDGRWEEVEEETKTSGRDLVAQYIQLFEMSGKPDDMANLVDYDYRNAKMSVFIHDDRASQLRRIDSEINRDLRGKFAGVTVAVTGMAKLILVVDELIVKGQLYSILTSLVLVWILTSLMFRSPVLGLFNTLPLFFALILNFIIMGLFSIPINLETMVTSSIAIGVGVDYAIHFVYRYQQKFRDSGNYEEAFVLAFADSGLAIVFNSFIVAAGFSIIALSQFVAVSYMGILITMTMLTSAAGALIVLPVLFIRFKPRIFRKNLGE